MGAMENKGLNVFNTSCTLASPETATDADYERVEGVIGHEYFHNWTGNRVTLRDWFQLTLKEGLTVFRDQMFSGDMSSPAVKRIEDVIMLKSLQFGEDAGPMSHPVRPESYIAMDNFYTLTVYEKGAEVVRMYHTLLGAQGFRKGPPRNSHQLKLTETRLESLTIGLTRAHMDSLFRRTDFITLIRICQVWISTSSVTMGLP